MVRIVSAVVLISSVNIVSHYNTEEWGWQTVGFGVVIGAIGGVFSSWLRLRQMNVLSDTILVTSVIIGMTFSAYPEKLFSLQTVAITLGVGIVFAILFYVTERFLSTSN